MSISQSLAIINFMNTLDNFLASMRINVDNNNPNSVIQMLNVIRCQSYGSSIDVFDKGIIFGVQACQIKSLGDTWGISYGPAGPDSSLIESENLNDWVITRGNLYNGAKIINIEPPTGQSYVYKIVPYITNQMENYLIPGSVLYSTISSSFRTVLLGQTNINYPVIAVEKTGIDKAKFINSGLCYKYFDSDFRLSVSSSDIEICRFMVDVNTIDDYEISILNHRDLYPFIYGQPYSTFYIFAEEIYKNIKSAIISGYDSELVYNTLYYIINANIWGNGTNAFYTYWTTGGRSLPSNVKYYYNILFTPPIP